MTRRILVPRKTSKRTLPARPRFEDLLAQTAGTWKAGDGLKYQRKLRAEWKV